VCGARLRVRNGPLCGAAALGDRLGHVESSAVLRCLPTPSKAEPRAFARVVSRRHARLLGDEPGWCVGHVYGSGMVRCRVGGGSGDEAAAQGRSRTDAAACGCAARPRAEEGRV